MKVTFGTYFHAKEYNSEESIFIVGRSLEECITRFKVEVLFPEKYVDDRFVTHPDSEQEECDCEDVDECECGHVFDKNKYIEVDPDPNCKICEGTGCNSKGNDCKCIFKKVVKNEED